MSLPDPQAPRRSRGDLATAIRLAAEMASNKYLAADLLKVGRLYERIIVPEVERRARANGLSLAQALDGMCEE